MQMITPMLLGAVAEGLAGPMNETVMVGNRPVLAIVPACAREANSTVPLVVSFHAWGTTAAIQQNVDNFASHLAPGRCFVVAYPQGLEKAWGPFGVTGFSSVMPSQTTACVADLSHTGRYHLGRDIWQI